MRLRNAAEPPASCTGARERAHWVSLGTGTPHADGRRGLRAGPGLPSGTARHGMAWHGMAWHGTAWYGMARHGMARHGTVWYGMARHGMAWHGMARHGTAWHGMLPSAMACQHHEPRTSAFPFMPAPLSLEVAAS